MKSGINLPKTIVLAGLASWISLIAFNNITDPGTNISLLGQMFTMEAIKSDAVMGNGLEWRALSQHLAGPMLVTVIILQVAIAALLWRAAALFARHLLQTEEETIPVRAIQAANLGLAAFMSLWFFFLCGGLWFGYWMKLGPVQGVHFTLLMVTVLALLLINYLPQPFPATHIMRVEPAPEREREPVLATNGVHADPVIR